MSEIKSEVSKKRKVGRPRKKRTGLPQLDMISAIEYTKRAYEKIGTAINSFGAMAEAMEIKKAWATKAFGELSDDYGLIEKVDSGWRVSGLGRRVVEREKSAVIEVLLKNKKMLELYDKFKDESVTKEFIEDYVKKKKTFITASLVADRFLEAINYINKLEVEGKPSPPPEPKAEWFSVIQLKYALTPPKQEEISDLANEVAEGLKKNEDASIRILSNRIKQNLENRSVLITLVDSIVDILSEKYPILVLKTKIKKQAPEKAKEER